MSNKTGKNRNYNSNSMGYFMDKFGNPHIWQKIVCQSDTDHPCLQHSKDVDQNKKNNGFC